MGRYSNPVLPGCHPDPTVCRVGADYFLVTSTFEYFPGLPVFHSRDLVNWTQIGHALERPTQLDLSTVPSSGGLYAPTLRHHDGTFHLICTLVHGEGRQGHFLLTATDAAGPWSDPVWIDGDGIDPSLFFDEDGSAWFHATRVVDPGSYEGETEVWLRRLDMETMRLVGEETVLWRGALTGAIWAEGPHLYRVDGRYYLLAAEGGTSANHAISVASSDVVTGPYLGNPGNPVLTHRDLGSHADVVNVGHADLVDTPDGRWWSVLLATRTIDGHESLFGRETHLVPVEWENGWPLFAPGVGRVLATFSGDGIPDAFGEPEGASASPRPSVIDRDDFDAQTLGLAWSSPRTGSDAGYSLTARSGHLRLLPQPHLDVFIGQRLRHFDAELRASIDLATTEAASAAASASVSCAGVALRRSDEEWLALSVEDASRGRTLVARLGRRGGTVDEFGTWPVDGASSAVELSIRVRGLSAELVVAAGAAEERVLGVVDVTSLGAPHPTGFLGVWAGVVARGSTPADVDWIEYRAL